MRKRKRLNRHNLQKEIRKRRKRRKRRRIIFSLIILMVFVLAMKLMVNKISNSLVKSHEDMVINTEVVNEKKNTDINLDTNVSENEKTDFLNSKPETSNIDENKVTNNMSSNLEKQSDIVEESSPKDFKEIYKRDMFFGDSITEGITFFEFLDDNQVIGIPGINIWNADDQISKAIKSQPENFYMLFGLNDIDNVLTSEKFAKLYGDLINKIKLEMPDTQIYIQSILPVLPKAAKKKASLTNENIDEFNNALQDLAKKEGVQYLNISDVLKEQDNTIYESDGIHFKEKFYPMWLNYIMENTKSID
ncbi:GDSL-type esterase/lipase family protein [Clostridium sediminicola]|uniref:GDSL-type esterase/lipase family protein n=1 Tax=Clostridium sediminicola TaxID=3114879 RepID=UPI003D165BD8